MGETDDRDSVAPVEIRTLDESDLAIGPVEFLRHVVHGQTQGLLQVVLYDGLQADPIHQRSAYPRPLAPVREKQQSIKKLMQRILSW